MALAKTLKAHSKQLKYNAMPFVNVYIHFVWSTKNREPFLETKEIRDKVWFHIKENAKKKGIFVDFVNGYSQHCHCLVSLGVDQTISNIMQLIKGESSYWINKEGLTKEKFEWQDEYYGVSVSESLIERVRNYIKNQEVHHDIHSYGVEIDNLIIKYGFHKFKD
ncbi:MAG: IS200/IS605 family transposase [Paludibacter sp.]|nr:IS200/IS605 family transposase [Paludibacter sp.]